MKKILILVVMFALVVQPTFGFSKTGAAQDNQGIVMTSPLARTSNYDSGMPGWPVPDKPIPHHEPGQLARSASASYTTTRLNALGEPELVQLNGLDALLADGTLDDPLAGNYTLVGLDKFMFSEYNFDEDPDNFSVSSYAWDGSVLTEIPGSTQNFGDYWINDIAAGDLNRDHVDEQIVAWVNQDSQIEVSIRDAGGSVNPITSNPGVVAHPDGTLDILARGYDYALWRLHYDGSWGSWDDDAGGWLLSAPAVASRAKGEMDLFAIGEKNQVYQTHATPDSFSSWTKIEIDNGDIWDDSLQAEPNPGVPAPAVVSYAGKLTLFRLAPDQTLRWTQSTDGVTWSSWGNLGGMLASAPAAVSLQDGRIQVYALGMDGALWYCTFTDPTTGGTWKHLQSPAGVAQGALPVLVSPAVGQVAVYLAGADNEIWTNMYNGSTWTGWSSIEVDGELGLGIGAANGPGGAYLVALLEDGSLIYQQNASAWAPLPALPLLPQTTLLVGATTKPAPDPTAELENSILGISTGYFKGDGRQQIILAYDGVDDNLRLEIYDIQNGFYLHKIAELVAPLVGGYPSVAAGDVNGDGVDEIGLVHSADPYNCYLRVLQLVKSSTAPTPYILEQIAEDHWWVYLHDQFYYFAGSLRIAAGDIVPEDDPSDEFVVLSDWYGYGDIVLAYLRVYDNDTDDFLFFSNWYEADMAGQVAPTIFYTGFDVAAGNVDGSGLDEIIFTYPSSGSVYQPYPEIERDLWIFACNKDGCTSKASRWGPITSNYTFLDRLEVADLDQDLKDEIVLARTSGVVPSFYTALDIYEYETTIVMLYGYVLGYDTVPRAFNLAVGDFTGEGIHLGPPTYRMQQRMISPEIFLNLPPMHRDILTGVGEIEINNGATATYSAGNTTTIESSSQSNHEWSLSVGMESSVGGVGGTVETSLENTYGENFSKTETEINTIKFEDTTIAQYYDQVVSNSTNYGIWEYPILGVETDPPGEPTTLAVVFPLVDTTTQPTTAQGRACDENFYTPSHQPYNVWSYGAVGDVRFSDYDPLGLVGSKQTSGGTTFEITMQTVDETLRSDSFSNQVSAGLEYSYENELEIPLIGKAWDFSFRAYANGEYKIEEISTLKSTFTDETVVEVDFPGIPDPSAYDLIAFLYWAKAGYLVLDYQTYPSASGSWGLYDKTDPAFILPWYGFPDPDTGVFPSLPDPDAPPCGPDKQLFTHDIGIEPAYAQNGATVTLNATLRNFSNITPSADVLVRFYLGHPGAGNQIASCSITKSKLARVYGPAGCETDWLVSGASGEEKIYAVIDPATAQKPYGAFDEMHDEGDIINNNIGYGLLYAADADYFDPGLRQVKVYQPILYEESPGLDYGLYIPTANTSETVRYELVPIDLGPLSIVGVPIQVQAFLGGQQFPEEDHPFSPIPAGLMVTYNDADLLPGMVESALRLYRLDGTTWVDATCPELDFYRFANDNAVAVPICQTGIFVLSDKEPVLLQIESFLPFVRK